MTTENRRGFNRIHYPAEARPRLLLDGPGSVRMVYEVLECSERGLRFLAAAQSVPPAGTAVSGVVHFAQGAEARIAGSVMRAQGDEVALSLSRVAIPLTIIVEEQRLLSTGRAHDE